jgi:hypothetical protein
MAKKVEEFSKVLDSLDNRNKSKLLASAKGLMMAQNIVRINSTKLKSLKNRKPKMIKEKI